MMLMPLLPPDAAVEFRRRCCRYAIFHAPCHYAAMLMPDCCCLRQLCSITLDDTCR